jgi:hypothetical protein
MGRQAEKRRGRRNLGEEITASGGDRRRNHSNLLIFSSPSPRTPSPLGRRAFLPPSRPFGLGGRAPSSRGRASSLGDQAPLATQRAPWLGGELHRRPANLHSRRCQPRQFVVEVQVGTAKPRRCAHEVDRRRDGDLHRAATMNGGAPAVPKPVRAPSFLRRSEVARFDVTLGFGPT